MYLGWTKHLTDEEDKKRFQDSLYSSKQVMNRLKALVDLEIEAIDQTEGDPKAYDNPSWAYKQAFKNGMRKGFKIIKEWVDLDKQQPPLREKE